MSTPIRTYAFINAKLRARISKLLTPELFQRLINAHTLEEVLSILHETPYEIIEEIYKKTGDLKLGELELFTQEVKIYRELIKNVTGVVQNAVKALLLKYEIENLKDGIRLFFDKVVRKRSIEHIIHYLFRERIVHVISIEQIVNATSTEQMIDALGASPYKKIVTEIWPQVEEAKTLFSLEIALDRFYYTNLVKEIASLNQRDSAYVQRLIGIEIDLYNITWIIRGKHYYNLTSEQIRGFVIPGGNRLRGPVLQQAIHTSDLSSIIKDVIPKSLPGGEIAHATDLEDIAGNLSLIEQILHEIMRSETKKALAGYPFSIGIILAYSMLKRYEIEKIRTICNAKQYALSPEHIKGML